MIRLYQKQGFTKWTASTFLDLQEQIYKAIEQGILPDTNLILDGVETTISGQNYTVSEGLVYIDREVCIFEGYSTSVSTSQPLYLTKFSEETANRPYADGSSQATRIKLTASASTTQPSESHITITGSMGDKYRPQSVYIDANGALQGIPKTDSLTTDDSDKLASAKAVHDLYAKRSNSLTTDDSNQLATAKASYLLNQEIESLKEVEAISGDSVDLNDYQADGAYFVVWSSGGLYPANSAVQDGGYLRVSHQTVRGGNTYLLQQFVELETANTYTRDYLSHKGWSTWRRPNESHFATSTALTTSVADKMPFWAFGEVSHSGSVYRQDGSKHLTCTVSGNAYTITHNIGSSSNYLTLVASRNTSRTVSIQTSSEAANTVIVQVYNISDGSGTTGNFNILFLKK